jgi:tRNA(Ile)-lysidine synthase
MLNRFIKHIEHQLSFLTDKKLLVACSGGLDSVVLTHLLKESDFDIGLAHYNFFLRGNESDEDENFVDELAKKYGIPFLSETIDTEKYAETNKLSTQMAARELRYEWFDVLLKDFNYDYVLTAHHADDDLETFLINLSRGTGLRGLTGIQEVNDKVVRPLLSFSREEILQYAKTNELYWREDSSNAKTDYLRNKLRHNVIPQYKETIKNALQNFRKTQHYLKGSRALVDDYMELIYNLVMKEVGDGYEIDIQKISELPSTQALLFELLYPFGFSAWDDISELLTAQTGKQVFSSTHRLVKDRDVLLLNEISTDSSIEELNISEGTSEIRFPIELHFELAERFEITNANTVFVDNDDLSYPLLLRRWNDGDVFRPFGMEGKKKLSKFFKDEKLSLVAKEKVWVLCSNRTIVWVVGMRLDERFKVSKKTKNIIRIDYTPT